MNTTQTLPSPQVAAAKAVPGHPGYTTTMHTWAGRSYTTLDLNGVEIARGSRADLIRSLNRKA